MADKTTKKREGGEVRRKRVRSKVVGTPQRPRLTVCKTLRHMYAQIIDDTQGVTLVAAGSNTKTLKAQADAAKSKVEEAKLIGIAIASAAKEKGIVKVVFDRNKFRYHGRIKAIADGAREGGLQF